MPAAVAVIALLAKMRPHRDHRLAVVGCSRCMGSGGKEGAYRSRSLLRVARGWAVGQRFAVCV